MKAATSNILANYRQQVISIHAAREGGDASTPLDQRADELISIHAAREGGDAAGYAVTGFNRISIHAAREGGDYAIAAGAACAVISIHAAREGGDAFQAVQADESGNFNPRRP